MCWRDEFNLPISSFHSLTSSTVLPTFRSKSNSNTSSTVALKFPTCPLMISPFLKGSETFLTFNVSVCGSHPFNATNPDASPLFTMIFSFSKNWTFSNSGVNTANSSALITLPNEFVASNDPPVDPIPAIEYETLSVPDIVLIPVTVK